MRELVGQEEVVNLVLLFLLFLKLFLIWGICIGVEVVGVILSGGDCCLIRSGREGDGGRIGGGEE